MDRRSKSMLIIACILMVLLIGKSLWYDPAGVLEGERGKFQSYASSTAPLENSGLLEKLGLLHYRVLFVLQESDEGTTEISYFDKEMDQQVEVVLEGQYRAKVRAYLFYVIPVKEMQIKGGTKG
ncbi:hypothetical protein Amet_4499 [Alkaliphilus metalliredigens QYMF]|uniref:Uncharacterized protein n=1 Tax=Alkaliphilus metalliredigens (strain QYMF) TaxID=293826 RepID=A6TWK3_ALKMQ|nr:hypothetical protein [Alkaliphilus metalliredigens]ABR50571.1 hypothetical protein Amet_4499 [Alkaliphilus metalliredigens QYMF]